MQVSEVMSRQVEWIAPDATITDAAAKMRERNIGALPVAEDNRLVGMLTDRDIVVRCIAGGADPQQMRVREVMSERLYFCREDQSVDSVASGMGTAQVRRMPVVDADRRLVGILSLGDVAQGAQPEATGEALREIAGPPSE